VGQSRPWFVVLIAQVKGRLRKQSYSEGSYIIQQTYTSDSENIQEHNQ